MSRGVLSVHEAPGLASGALRRGPDLPTRPEPARPNRVLLLSSSPLTQAIESQSVIGAGCECTPVATPDAALVELRRRPVSLVLIDAQTAWQDGAESCRKLKAAAGPAPVVLAAGAEAPTELIEECWRAGIDDCILRPLRTAALKARLGALEPAAPGARPGPVILLAGQDLARRAVLEEALGVCGYRVLSAEAAASPPDPVELVVICSASPALEAAALSRQLGAAAPGLRWLFVSPAPAAPLGADARLVGCVSDLDGFPEAVLRRVDGAFNRGAGALRASERVPFFCPVEFREGGGSRDEPWLSSYSFDISAGGVFLKTLVPARPRSALELTIHLTTTREKVQATGVVAWSNPWAARGVYRYPVGMGVQFLGTVSRSLALLIEACRASAEEKR